MFAIVKASINAKKKKEEEEAARLAGDTNETPLLAVDPSQTFTGQPLMNQPVGMQPGY